MGYLRHWHETFILNESRGDVNVFEGMQFTSPDIDCEIVKMAIPLGEQGIFLFLTSSRLVTTSIHYILK